MAFTIPPNVPDAVSVKIIWGKENDALTDHGGEVVHSSLCFAPKETLE